MVSACLGVPLVAAQPVERTRDGVFVTVPKEVIVHASEVDPREPSCGRGRTEIVTERKGPYGLRFDPKRAVPEKIPIRTKFSDGTEREGYWVERMIETPSYSISYAQPWSITWNADRGYEPSIGCVQHRSEHNENTPWPRGARKLLLLPVYQFDVPFSWTDEFVPRGNFTVLYSLPQALPPNFPRGEVEAVLARVAHRFERVMIGSRGSVAVKIEFQSISSLADTSLSFVNRTLAGVEQGLTLQWIFDSEFDAEQILDAFPSAQVECLWNNDIQNPVTINFGIVTALRSQVPISSPPSPAQDGIIRVNQDRLFDFDASDGIPLLAYDFEAMMTHETAHVLGFFSRADDADVQTARNTMTLWDMFRFPQAASISLGQFTTGLRYMANNDPNFGVVFPTQFSNPAFTHACALGLLANNQQADHWVHRDPPLQKIGIMDPTYMIGENPAFDDCLSQADWGALDVIGWNITRPVAAVVPQRPNSLTPISGASLVSKTPALSWSAFGDTASVFVHAGTEQTATSEKWRASGLTASNATPPAGILQGRRDVHVVRDRVQQRGFRGLGAEHVHHQVRRRRG